MPLPALDICTWWRGARRGVAGRRRVDARAGKKRRRNAAAQPQGSRSTVRTVLKGPGGLAPAVRAAGVVRARVWQTHFAFFFKFEFEFGWQRGFARRTRLRRPRATPFLFPANGSIRLRMCVQAQRPRRFRSIGGAARANSFQNQPNSNSNSFQPAAKFCRANSFFTKMGLFSEVVHSWSVQLGGIDMGYPELFLNSFSYGVQLF